MGLTIVVSLAFLVGMVAILYFGHEQGEIDRAERAAAEARRAHLDAQMAGRTADEVVFDLEHRIDSDLRDLAASMSRVAPGRDSRPHQA